MGWFVIAIIFWLAALVLVLAAVVSTGARKAVCGGAAVIVALLGVGLFALAGIQSVPVKNIGVPSSFGSVGSKVYSPGTYETWDPFLHLTNVDETVQTTTFEGGNALKVRIGGQQQATADITIQWQILPSAAPTLYSDYANHGDLMDTITNAVVIREFKQVVNQVVGDYDPISDYQNVVNTKSSTSQFTSFGPTIQRDMQADIGNLILVKSVQLPIMNYSPAVETKLQEIQQAYANFAIASENVNVNHENALAFAQLGTPTVAQLVAQCLKDVESNTHLPTGFQCFPGSGSTLALSGK